MNDVLGVFQVVANSCACKQSKLGISPNAHLGDGTMDVVFACKTRCVRLNAIKMLMVHSTKADRFALDFIRAYRAANVVIKILPRSSKSACEFTVEGDDQPDIPSTRTTPNASSNNNKTSSSSYTKRVSTLLSNGRTSWSRRQRAKNRHNAEANYNNNNNNNRNSNRIPCPPSPVLISAAAPTEHSESDKEEEDERMTVALSADFSSVVIHNQNCAAPTDNYLAVNSHGSGWFQSCSLCNNP